MTDWPIYKGVKEPHGGIEQLPPPPPWRTFSDVKLEGTLKDSEDKRDITRGETFQASEDEIELVNAALYLRRPLLITGKPGIGKSSLAYAVAHELRLGRVLNWPITTRSTVQEGLYRYDAIGRLQEANMKRNAAFEQETQQDSASDIGQFVRLGPLGTALIPSAYPRVLLIDEIDKSDIDLPNDLLNIFEEGEFYIPELVRLSKKFETVQVRTYDENDQVSISQGHVRCNAFPFIVLTSNGEREFPPPFLRRCIRLDIKWPENDDELKEKLTKIVEAHLGLINPDEAVRKKWDNLITQFTERAKRGDLATDQLLNALYLTTIGINPLDKEKLINVIFKYLTGVEGK